MTVLKVGRYLYTLKILYWHDKVKGIIILLFSPVIYNIYAEMLNTIAIML